MADFNVKQNELQELALGDDPIPVQLALKDLYRLVNLLQLEIEDLKKGNRSKENKIKKD